MAVMDLRVDTEIIVLKADNGNAVVMDVKVYDRKIKDFLEHSLTYKPIKYNSFAAVKRQTGAVIAEYRNTIPNDVEKKLLRPRIVQLRLISCKFYGLTNIHKPT